MPVKQVFVCHQTEDPLSYNTISHYHRLISAVLSSAKRKRVISFNVAKEQCDAPQAEKKEAKFLTDEQVRVFLNALEAEPDIRIRTALILLLFTGLRRGELCGLSWFDISMSEMTIHIHCTSQVQKDKGVTEVSTKNHTSIRTFKISRYVVDTLKQYNIWWNEHKLYLGSLWSDTKGKLFVQYNGKPLYPTTINYWLNKFLKQHIFRHFSPHSLRHTFCTLELVSGVDYRTLQSMSGHAQASTLVNTYGHVVQHFQEEAAQSLEDTLIPNKDNKIE